MRRVAELSIRRTKTPRRAQSTHEHIPSGPQPMSVHQARSPFQGSPLPTINSPTLEKEQFDFAAATPVAEAPSPAPEQKQSAIRRPKLPPPRRSYSVMEYEPVPPEQRPGNLTLRELPGEIHYAIFDWLDPIDSTCLGLTNKHFYDIHRRMHGSVPLSVRRNGPNELEWAWHLAGTRLSPPATPIGPPPSSLGPNDKQALTALRVRGKGLCRKCGISRCELQKHLKDWVPEDYEYCSVRDKFVPCPSQEAKPYCYMSNPNNSHRCGRHRVKKAKEAAQ